MKTAFELAMERLSKNAPTVRLSDETKRKLAEVDSIYAAKLAQRELLVNAELAKAQATGEYETLEQLQKQLVSDRKTIEAEKEEKKEQIRKSDASNP